MHATYHSKRDYHSDLPDLLTTFYSVDTIWKFYYTAYLPALGKEIPAKRPLKKKMVEDILRLENNPQQMKKLVAGMPRKLYATINALLWVVYAYADQVESELGFDIYEEKKSRNPYWQEDEASKSIQENVPPSLDIIANHAGDSYYDYDECLDTKISEPALSLPPALRAFFRPHFPKPIGYDFEAQNEQTMPKDAQRFDGSSDIVNALTQLADYLSRTPLKTTKTGKISKATLRSMLALTGAAEPYANDKANKELAELRHELLIHWLYSKSAKELTSIAEGKKAPGDILRDILKELPKDPDFIHDDLLPHLKLKNSYDEHDTEHAAYYTEAIEYIYKQLPVEGWVTRENIQSYQGYREIEIHPTTARRYTARLERADDVYNYGAQTFDIDKYNFTALIEYPLLDGLSFFFAALGLVEVIYTAPKNRSVTRPKKDYLTPFEGIHALRLTELGAYAFGHTNKLNLKASRANRAEMHFHPQRLHLRCLNLDPVTELTAKEFMEPISHTRFRLTRASLIGKANTQLEIKRRIQDFKRRIGQELPANWLEFIEQLESEKPALNWSSSLSVYQLPDNPALHRAFSKDPILRELCLKAEGWHVVVNQKDMPKLKARLRKLGFICE